MGSQKFGQIANLNWNKNLIGLPIKEVGLSKAVRPLNQLFSTVKEDNGKKNNAFNNIYSLSNVQLCRKIDV